MKDVNGTEVTLGCRIAVSRGRRGYLTIGKVTEIKERVRKSYRHGEVKDVTSRIVTYTIDNPTNTWDRGSYVKMEGKFVVIG
jgi:hypothetical protein